MGNLGLAWQLGFKTDSMQFVGACVVSLSALGRGTTKKKNVKFNPEKEHKYHEKDMRDDYYHRRRSSLLFKKKKEKIKNYKIIEQC